MNSAEQPTCRLKAGAVVYQSTILEVVSVEMADDHGDDLDG